jgi:hypothetical protein
MGRVYKQLEDAFNDQDAFNKGTYHKRAIVFDVEYGITTMKVIRFNGETELEIELPSREFIPLLGMIALDCAEYVK